MHVFLGYLVLIIFLLLFTSVDVFASPKKEENLFATSGVHLEQELSVGITADTHSQLIDGDTQTYTSLIGSKDSPAELVFSFSNQTISPRELKFQFDTSNTGLGQIEILVSTLSSSAGFTSLRSEPMRKSNSLQSFYFEQTAAKWVMIRFTPIDKQTTFVVAEIALLGHLGAPESNYAFAESPVDAFQVLSKLQETVDADLSEDEASMFEDAKDGSFDSWSFAEAALLSSGVKNKQQRQLYLSRLDKMEAQAAAVVKGSNTPFQKGDRLLKWLHKGALNKGYVSKQTDVSKVFDTKTYNCVSSATLYNILATRLGLDTRAIEVPDHAFSIIYDGTKHADVETTTKAGFNPSRDRAAISKFKLTTGFTYIPDTHRAKRRELKETGLVAITYYNHGVGFTKSKQYHHALLSYFRALSLDPENKSAVKNALSVLSTWSLELAETGNFDKAFSVLAVGLQLAPDDKGLKHNNKYVWRQKIDSILKSNDITSALAVLDQAYQKTSDKDFIKMQSWVFLSQGEKFVAQENWEQALTLAEQGLVQVDPSVKKEIAEWRTGIILRWSNKAMKKNKFQLASDILEKGLAFENRDYRIANNLGYIAQEWSKHVTDTEGSDAGELIITQLITRFPKLENIQRAASAFVDRKADEAIKQDDYKRAIEIYQQARLNNPDDSHLKSNEEATWVSWANIHIEKKQWKQALDIYEQAHTNHPDVGIFKRNISYIIQEWAQQVTKSDGNEAAEKLVSELTPRFPNIKSVQKASGKNTILEIQKLIKAEQYQQAQTMLSSSKELFAKKSLYDNMVVNLYHHWSNQFSAKGDFESAINIYNNGLNIHPDNSNLKNNMIATWVSWAKGNMENKLWEQALNVYEKAHASHPDAGIFKQNISYIIQEWAQQISKSESNEAAEKLVSELMPRFPNIKSVQEAGGKNTAREVEKLIKAGQFQQAQTMLNASKEFFTKKSQYDNRVVNLYHYWSNQFSDKDDFESAVNIYNDALKNHPGNSTLKNNAIATWHVWAKPFLTKEQCSKAIEIYEDGLLKIPGASLFKNNISYCQSIMNAK